MEENTNQEIQTTNEVVEVRTINDIVRECLLNGWTRINGLKVRNVNFDEEYEDKDYIRISFTLDKAIPGFITTDNGLTYVKDKTNIIFTSTFALSALVKEDEDNAWMANIIAKKPKATCMIFNGATIDIIQTEIEAGNEVKNPFSRDENKIFPTYDHNVIVNNIVAVKFSRAGEKWIERLADKMLDI